MFVGRILGEETTMRGSSTLRLFSISCLSVASILMCSPLLMGQEDQQHAVLRPPSAGPAIELQSLVTSIRELQDQVRALHSELDELKSKQQYALEVARELQGKLDH